MSFYHQCRLTAGWSCQMTLRSTSVKMRERDPCRGCQLDMPANASAAGPVLKKRLISFIDGSTQASRGQHAGRERFDLSWHRYVRHCTALRLPLVRTQALSSSIQSKQFEKLCSTLSVWSR